MKNLISYIVQNRIKMLFQTFDDDIRKQKFQTLDPWQFEKYCSYFIEKYMGLKVIHKKYDKGVDILAGREDKTGTLHQVIIQCKHHASDITPNYVRELNGSREFYPEAEEAILITSGHFSDGAITAAEELNIKLIDGRELTKISEKL